MFRRLKLAVLPHRLHGVETLFSVVVCLLLFTGQVAAVTKFQERSLLINNTEPGSISEYTISFRYESLTNVGSLDLLFCVDPIPYMPCNAPTGIDVSNAVLTSQTGNTGFSITQSSSNHILLSRSAAGVVDDSRNTYVLSGIRNPIDMSHSYAIRMHNFASTDGTGSPIDVGAVVTQVAGGVSLETQVPPILLFCVGERVSDDCIIVEDDINYSDMGEITSESTLTAESQMAAGTNASSGFVITVNSIGMAAGTTIINSPSIPTESRIGTNQFGINLVANNSPEVGKDPDGESINGVAAPGYNQPNKFMYKDGDVVALAPNVSLVRRFTVSYILNGSSSLPAGVYTTTITYICTGRF